MGDAIPNLSCMFSFGEALRKVVGDVSVSYSKQFIMASLCCAATVAGLLLFFFLMEAARLGDMLGNLEGSSCTIMNDDGCILGLGASSGLSLLRDLAHLHLLQTHVHETLALPVKPERTQHIHKHLLLSHTCLKLGSLFSFSRSCSCMGSKQSISAGKYKPNNRFRPNGACRPKGKKNLSDLRKPGRS